MRERGGKETLDNDEEERGREGRRKGRDEACPGHTSSCALPGFPSEDAHGHADGRGVGCCDGALGMPLGVALAVVMGYWVC